MLRGFSKHRWLVVIATVHKCTIVSKEWPEASQMVLLYNSLHQHAILPLFAAPQEANKYGAATSTKLCALHKN